MGCKLYLVSNFFKSRWSSGILGPFYGLFIYYWITYMVLKGPPFTEKLAGGSHGCRGLDEDSTQQANKSYEFENLISTTEIIPTTTKTILTETVLHNQKAPHIKKHAKGFFDIKWNASGLNSTLDDLFEEGNPAKSFKYQPMMTVETRYTE